MPPHNVARLPDHLMLSDDVVRGDCSTNITLWKRKQEPGMWERIRSSAQPESIPLSDDVEGVKVAISQWRERTRGLLKRLFKGKPDADVMTDIVPLAGGKEMEVEQAVRGSCPALLAWAREGREVKFDEMLVAQLCPENEGHEVLSTRHDLCLLHGEWKKEAAKAIEEQVDFSALSLAAAQSYIKEVEGKFAHRIRLADYPEETHIPGCECLEAVDAKRALVALRVADSQGISRTEIYVPEKAQKAVSLIGLIHCVPSGLREACQYHMLELPPQREYSKGQHDLFCLFHVLRDSKRDHSIFLEGISCNSDALSLLRQQEEEGRDIAIPTVELPVYSPEGQEYIRKNPWVFTSAGLSTNIDARHFLIASQFPGLRGAECDEFKELDYEHSNLKKEMWKIAAKYQSSQMKGYGVTIDPHRPEAVFIGGASFPRRQLLQDMKSYLSLRQRESEMHSMREEFVVSHMKTIASTGVPHLFFGDAHRFRFLSRFADERVAVILTTLTSFPPLTIEEHCALFADAKCTDCVRAFHLVNLLETR